MLCTRERSPVRYRSEERHNPHVRQRIWKAPTNDVLQIGAIGLFKLMAPTKVKLVKALKLIVAIAEKESMPNIGFAESGVQHTDLQAKRCVPLQAQKIYKEEQSQDILVYGSDANTIESLVGSCIQEAVHPKVPCIILNGNTLKTTTSAGLRTILESKYRALNEPQFVLIILENFSEEMILKFESSGFREKCRSQGGRAVVVAWTCMQKGKSFDRNILAPFTTQLFVPSSEDEKPEQGESQHRTFQRTVFASASNQKPDSSQRDVEEKQGIAETTLTTQASVPTGTSNTNLAKSEGVYSEGTTTAGPSGATSVYSDVGLVGRLNPFPILLFPLPPLPRLPPVPPVKPLPKKRSMRNDGMQIQKPIFQQPLARKPETQNVRPSTAVVNVPGKQLKDVEIEVESESRTMTVWENIVGCCVAVFECL